MIRQGATMLYSPAVWMPEELEDAWQLKQQFGSEACYIAGGTQMQTHWQKGLDYPAHLISLEGIKEMLGWGKEQVKGETVTRLGSLTTLDFCQHHPELLKDVPLLVEAVGNIAAPAIRNKATIGGNIANGYGDLIPAFLAMDTILSLYDEKEFLLTSLWDYLKEGKSFANTILNCVYLPGKIEGSKDSYFYKKIGHREAFSPSVVTISGCCQLNEKSEVEHIRLAAGGSTTPPQRLVGSEQLLKGSTLSNEQLKKAVQAIKKEFLTSSDAFSSADYKRAVAANMIVSEIVRFAG